MGGSLFDFPKQLVVGQLGRNSAIHRELGIPAVMKTVSKKTKQKMLRATSV